MILLHAAFTSSFWKRNNLVLFGQRWSASLIFSFHLSVISLRKNRPYKARQAAHFSLSFIIWLGILFEARLKNGVCYFRRSLMESKLLASWKLQNQKQCCLVKISKRFFISWLDLGNRKSQLEVCKYSAIHSFQ